MPAKIEGRDARVTATAMMTTTEKTKYITAISRLDQRRIKVGQKRIYESRLMRLMFLRLSKDPQSVLDFLKYDDNN